MVKKKTRSTKTLVYLHKTGSYPINRSDSLSPLISSALVFLGEAFTILKQVSVLYDRLFSQ